MTDYQSLMSVANSCDGYEAAYGNFQSSIGAYDSKSCSNCRHFENNKCNINLFDKVLSSLDQA